MIEKKGLLASFLYTCMVYVCAIKVPYMYLQCFKFLL